MSPPDYQQPLEPIAALGPGAAVTPAVAPAAAGPNAGGYPERGSAGSVPLRAGTPAAGAAAGAAPVDARIVQAAVDRINARLAADGQALQLSVDPTTGRRMILVRDTNTGAMIRQIPSEDALRIASALESDDHSNLLLDLKA